MNSFAISARISRPVVKTERIMHKTDFSRSLNYTGSNARARHRDLDYEDYQTLKKQQSDVLVEIADLIEQNEMLRRKLEEAERERDEEELAEIEVYAKTVTDREQGYHETRVFNGSKRVIELQEEMKSLDRRLEKLSMDYSADVEHKLKVYVCMQRNNLHNLEVELNEFNRGIDFTREELDGEALGEAHQIFRQQRTVIRDMKKRLAKLQAQEKDLKAKAEALQSEQPNPADQQKQLRDLKRRYDTLVRVRKVREREKEDLGSLFETEKANTERENERKRMRKERREKARQERELAKQREQEEMQARMEEEEKDEGSSESSRSYSYSGYSYKEEKASEEEEKEVIRIGEQEEKEEDGEEEKEDDGEEEDVGGKEQAEKETEDEEEETKEGAPESNAPEGGVKEVLVAGFRQARNDMNIRIEDPEGSDDDAEKKDEA